MTTININIYHHINRSSFTRIKNGLIVWLIYRIDKCNRFTKSRCFVCIYVLYNVYGYGVRILLDIHSVHVTYKDDDDDVIDSFVYRCQTLVSGVHMLYCIILIWYGINTRTHSHFIFHCIILILFFIVFVCECVNFNCVSCWNAFFA